jgi:hypothetical protein
MPVPDFSPGEVLTAAAMDSIGLWLVKTQTIGAGVGSVTVTDAFSADYENYKIVVTGGSSSAATTVSLQLGATVTGYYTFQISGSFIASTVTGANISNGSSFNGAGRCAADGILCLAELFLPYETKKTLYTTANTRPETGGVAGWQSGFLDTATSYTAFTLSPGTGTFTGGTIRVYGYRN